MIPTPQGVGGFCVYGSVDEDIPVKREVIEMTDDETGATGTFWHAENPITFIEEENNV